MKDILWMFERLLHDKLYTKRKKCEFPKQEVEYLGHIVKDGHMLIGPTRTEAI